jgi:hypothetical protein
MSKASGEPDNSGGKQGGRFQPGQSGNPAGKPPGARHKTTKAMEELLDGEAENITRRAIEFAMSGDPAALRLCMERLLPARKSKPVRIDLPKIETPADVANALSLVVAAVADGSLDPDDAETLARIVEVKRRSLETVEHEERLKKLEETVKGKKA